MIRRKAVVIGAGQTGRGYIARNLASRGYTITFIDVVPELIDMLNKDKVFNVHYYNKDATPVVVEKYDAFLAHTDAAKHAIQEADFVFTAVGEQNLDDVAQQLKEGLEQKDKRTVIMTCENGINPKRVLINHLEALGSVDAEVVFTQTAVFCSTVNLLQTRLDILSQNTAYFPYDAVDFDTLDFDGAERVLDFEGFLKRKIYTYNCLAGLISYVGYVKGFEVFGDAANSPDISDLMDRLLVSLNPALAKYFEITLDEQVAFANKALVKFKDKSILDYTIKNGRDAHRKLGPTERIMSPMTILDDNNGDTSIMEFIAACCIVYWKEQVNNGREIQPSEGFVEDFMRFNGLTENDGHVVAVKQFIQAIEANRDSVDIAALTGGN